MTDVQKIAFDTLKSGAPGLSDQTREALAGSIARKVALSTTTPARAEAQDEGAAGERGKSRGQVAYEGWAQGLPGCEWANQTRTQQRAWEKAAQAVIDAHPSPTPAADADRVREAIADVISHENDWRTALTAMDAAEETPEDGSGKPGYWLHQIKVLDRIVSAFKAEGK